MLNSIETYEELGHKAAMARNRSDEALAEFHADHFRRCRDMERDEDREAATTAYRKSYEASRNKPTPSYFR